MLYNGGIFISFDEDYRYGRRPHLQYYIIITCIYYIMYLNAKILIIYTRYVVEYFINKKCDDFLIRKKNKILFKYYFITMFINMFFHTLYVYTVFIHIISNVYLFRKNRKPYVQFNRSTQKFANI